MSSEKCRLLNKKPTHHLSLITYHSSLMPPLPCCNLYRLNISSELMSDVTQLLNAIERGAPQAASQLLPVGDGFKPLREREDFKTLLAELEATGAKKP
jgi:hypothetical protein